MKWCVRTMIATTAFSMTTEPMKVNSTSTPTAASGDGAFRKTSMSTPPSTIAYAPAIASGSGPTAEGVANFSPEISPGSSKYKAFANLCTQDMRRVSDAGNSARSFGTDCFDAVGSRYHDKQQDQRELAHVPHDGG